MADRSSGLPDDGVVGLGDREVRISRQRGAGPAVLLLGGCGVASHTWHAVVARLAGREVLRLVRPGLGGTRWPGVLPDLPTEVATLTALLEAAGPAVVVAHSMAGLHAEALARRRPDLVLGLVLADSSVERKPPRARVGEGWLALAHTARRAMRLPLVRCLGPAVDRSLVAMQSGRRLTHRRTSAERATFRDPEAVASVIAELAAYPAQIRALADLRQELRWPGIPTVVLTATGDGGPRWLAAQRDLAVLLGARHVTVPGARHLIMLDRPEVVAAAVCDLLTTHRAENDR